MWTTSGALPVSSQSTEEKIYKAGVLEAIHERSSVHVLFSATDTRVTNRTLEKVYKVEDVQRTNIEGNLYLFFGLVRVRVLREM